MQLWSRQSPRNHRGLGENSEVGWGYTGPYPGLFENLQGWKFSEHYSPCDYLFPSAYLMSFQALAAGSFHLSSAPKHVHWTVEVRWSAVVSCVQTHVGQSGHEAAKKRQGWEKQGHSWCYCQPIVCGQCSGNVNLHAGSKYMAPYWEAYVSLTWEWSSVSLWEKMEIGEDLWLGINQSQK